MDLGSKRDANAAPKRGVTRFFRHPAKFTFELLGQDELELSVG
jgi:hypothetical protein